jgi:hypothetical protein
MGGRPSFTPVVIGAVADTRGGRLTIEVLHIYQSDFFATPESLAWLGGRARLTLVPAVDGCRDAFLSVMRSAMLQDPPPAAAVTLGGRTSAGGCHSPGVAEEVELLVELGVPIVLLVVAGSGASQLNPHVGPTSRAAWPGLLEGRTRSRYPTSAVSNRYQTWLSAYGRIAPFDVRLVDKWLR